MRALLRTTMALLSLGIPGQALAAPAVIDHVTLSASGSFVEPNFFCLGPAVMTITETLRYQTVETTRGLHVEGIDECRFTADIEGGAYAVGGSTDRFAFNAGPSDTVNKDTHVDWVSVYGPDGEFLFDATFRAVEKFTITASGELRVDFVRVVFSEGPTC